MADKEATLKLTLKSDGFKAGLSDAEKAAAKTGAAMGKGISSAMSNAGKAGLDSLKGSLSSLKSAIGGIAGIAGGFGLVEFARRAISAEGQFKKLSFQIRAGTGEMRNWRDMQRDAQQTALKFGHTSEEVGKSISDLYAAVGDPKFAVEASKVVAQFATGAHEPLEVMTNLAGGLNEKFGVTAQELPDVLASVVSLGTKGGVSVADLAEKIGVIGANAKVAGLSGAKGFGTMVSWLNIADNATGTLKKGIAGVSGIIDSIATGANDKELKRAFSIDVPAMKKAGADFNTIIGKVLEKTGGKEGALAKIFSGDQLKVISEMGRTYATTFESTTGDVKAKTAAGLAAFDAALKEAGKSQLNAKDIAEEAAKEMETPEKKIATAMEKLAQVFTSEKMSHAFEMLADFLPKVVEQMMKHPLLTGALLSGVPQAVAGSLLKSLGEAIGGTKFGKGAPGAALPILAVAAGAFMGGKELIDAGIEREERRQDNTRAQGYAADDLVTNSRTMRGNPAEFAKLAIESDILQKSLQDRAQLARQMKFGGTSTSVDGILMKQAAEALPGGSPADREEWIKNAFAQGRTDSKDIGQIEQALSDATQAAANFRARAGGQDMSGATMADLGGGVGILNMATGRGAEEYGLGLGGEGAKGHKQIAREKAQEQAAAAEQAKQAQQKADNAGLIAGITDPITAALGKTLRAEVTNAEEIGKAAGGKPAKGVTPVE